METFTVDPLSSSIATEYIITLRHNSPRPRQSKYEHDQTGQSTTPKTVPRQCTIHAHCSAYDPFQTVNVNKKNANQQWYITMVHRVALYEVLTVVFLCFVISTDLIYLMNDIQCVSSISDE